MSGAGSAVRTDVAAEASGSSETRCHPAHFAVPLPFSSAAEANKRRPRRILSRQPSTLIMKSNLRLAPALKALLLLIASVPLLGISSFETLFAPKAEPWPRWKSNVPGSAIHVDHTPWNRILQRYLQAGADGINRFDYARLNRDGRQDLDAYLRELAAKPVGRMDRKSQMAFWINLYNALTVRTVAEAYPVKSIRDIDISPGLFGDGPWGKQLIRIEGVAVTLNDIEHRILRPLWGDPRIHYALNCASLGCPNLARRAYEPQNLDAMLDAGARAFINSRRGVWWDGDRLTVSSIYAWFQDDFGGNDVGILTHLRRYAEAKIAKRLASAKRIDRHDYDWRLNDSR